VAADRTVGSIYREIENSLQQSGLSDRVDLSFIDLFDCEIDPDSSAGRLITADYTPPLILIDGALRYYGGIAPAPILSAIRLAVENQANLDSEAVHPDPSVKSGKA
jgi:hypothetical protein